jgi:Ca2+-binding RTX toxin-like protein
MTLAALLATAVAALATAAPAGAFATSASIEDTTATLNLDGGDNNVTVSVVDGVLVHGQTTGGLNSGSDWNSEKDGVQTVPANGTFTVVINGGDGRDELAVHARNTEIASTILSGQGGDDALTGADSGDVLSGGDGNDRLTGAPGLDVMSGGPGNDTFVWNNGDGSDRLSGDEGNDVMEVNGSPNRGDAFVLTAVAGGIRFNRLNLQSFQLDTETERFRVNGLGGNDFVEADDPGVGAVTQLSVDGGPGADLVFGSDGRDVIRGGEGADTLNGGGGDDTFVWNDGDGSDVVNGDDGRDDVEVNGAPAGDAISVQPNGARTGLQRTNLVPFSIDIGSAETLHANGLGGEDTIAVGDVGSLAVTAAGGSGNDTLTGGASADTFLGGSGNDTITSGGGLDVVQGDDGDDRVNVRDGTADVARGGDGTDSVVADSAQLDIVDGFESVDRPPDVSPPPDVAPPPGGGGTVTPVAVTIRGGTVKVRNGTASIRLSCPVGSSSHCAGSLVVRTASPVKLARLRVVVQLGSARYDVAPGASRTLKVRLAKGSERLAGRTGRLKVVAVAATGTQGATASSRQRLTLALGAATRRARHATMVR